MKAQFKNVAITTATMLLAIYLLRRVSFTKTIVDTALNG